MKFEIPFKEKIYLDQVELMIPLIYRYYIKNARESIIVGILSSLLGVLIIVGKSYLGVIFIALGIWFLILSFPKFKLYNNLKKTHLTKTREIFAENDSNFGNGIFEFTDNSLRYTDKLHTRDIQWTEFKKYKVIDSNLFLILEREKGDIMAIGEQEIGTDNFNKVVDFIKTKIKK